MLTPKEQAYCLPYSTPGHQDLEPFLGSDFRSQDAGSCYKGGELGCVYMLRNPILLFIQPEYPGTQLGLAKWTVSLGL